MVQDADPAAAAEAVPVPAVAPLDIAAVPGVVRARDAAVVPVVFAVVPVACAAPAMAVAVPTDD
ncbi:hypothetical protein [Nocardia iowensis]|uniref:Uncharacterized protein n=1 Tax=Nocardia iowensis TaxID=204891 RepID=A0ABX8RRJ6_NOCIO|nr:hypothetical protein [Nocardia iowensis]QXN91632.1 hypothetical protein KV110_41205 [Nocardia iowensis]